MWTPDKSQRSLLLLLFLSLCHLSLSSFLFDLNDKTTPISVDSSESTTEEVVTRQAHVCKHGKWVKDDEGVERCECDDNYIGPFCHLWMHCVGYQRYENNTCLECEEHWEGDFCERIICDKGKPNIDGDVCICDKPHSGNFCETQTTQDVYLYYNSLMYAWGPIGVLFIIPLYIVLYGCRYMARKRQIKRVERALEEQRQDDVDSDIVDMLLHKKYSK
uniref:EGF-like domain-containing protein n=1 Tax=Steinernema glaseri TaxID=37863 RepID=A0A1I7YT86_9BILA